MTAPGLKVRGPGLLWLVLVVGSGAAWGLIGALLWRWLA